MSPRSLLLRVAAVAALVVFTQSSAEGQIFTLNANPTSNNGTGGVFMNFTPTTSSLQIVSFDTMFGAAATTAGQVQVWTRPGTYVGFTTANTGWTLTQTVNITSNGTTTLAPINLTTPIDLPFGGSTSVYVAGITAGNALRYFGTGTVSNTNFSNGDLTLFTDIARTGTVAFGGTQFTPRAWTGNINYTIAAVPEPSTLLLGGLAVPGFLMLRKRIRARRGNRR